MTSTVADIDCTKAVLNKESIAKLVAGVERLIDGDITANPENQIRAFLTDLKTRIEPTFNKRPTLLQAQALLDFDIAFSVSSEAIGGQKTSFNNLRQAMRAGVEAEFNRQAIAQSQIGPRTAGTRETVEA